MSLPIDLFNVFAQFGREHRISLRDPKALEVFIAHVSDAIATAVARDTLLHGQRTQNMFEALVVSLGNYKVLKTEDAGRIHPNQGFRVPDFRIILNDESQWLVEVKNIYDQEPFRQTTKFTRSYIAELQAYASAMRCPLKLGLYWARWRLWTLVTPEALIADGDKLSIDMMTAMRVSEMAAVGDLTIGTKPPLKLRFVADHDKPRQLTDTNEARFTIAGVKLYCGETEILDSIEKKIAWIFMQFGEWELSGPEPVMSGNDLEAVQFEWNPIEQTNVGFEMIGTLSRMFSGYYALQTLGDTGVIQTEAELTPNWFVPLVKSESTGDALPLWRFILRPNPERA
jgi:hypothetical protein